MNLMDLFIKIGVKDEASGPISKLSKSVGKGLATAAKIGTAAVGATATALGKLGMEAVKAYAGYEQLVGGVETLFDDLSGNVLANADKAFRAVGLSANEYMETAMSFAASLNQSLMRTDGNIARSASITDMAITDMADNANKMGTSMDSIQTAYAGFAKQNYTMLDNLKLGYGGTKQEMERLLADAEKFSGVKYDINNLSDVYEAIHIVQTELGITGTTAEEAAHTIAGSFGQLKASWKNFLTGLGSKDADIGKLTDQLIESAETLLENLEPVVIQVLESLGSAVERLGPIIGEKLPGIIMTLLPSLISGAMGLVGSLAQAVPEMLQMIFSAVDGAISESGFADTWNAIKETVAANVALIKENWDRLVVALQPLIDRVQTAWQGFVKWAEESGILEKAIDAIGTTINIVIAVIGGIATAFEATLSAAEEAADWIKEKWQPVADFFSGIADIISGIFAKAGQFAEKFGGGGLGVGLENIDWSGAAIGLDYVPYNGYPAVLHKGEAVLTATEADTWRQGGGSEGGKVVNLNIYAQQLSQADMDYIVATVNRELAP